MASVVRRFEHALFSRRFIQLENSRYFVASQQVFLAGLVMHVVFLWLFIWLGITELFLFNFVSIAVFSLSLQRNLKGKHNQALWPAYMEANIHALLAVFLLGWDSGFFYYLLAIGPMLFFNTLLTLSRKLLLASLPVVLMASLFLYMLEHPALYDLPRAQLNGMYIGNMLATFGLLAYLAHFFAQGADESEARLRTLKTKFEELAIRDPLTQLLNRRAITQEIDTEISRFSRLATPFVIAIGDIDGFKSYNDRFGHRCGDLILQHLASMMPKHTRAYDRISRWGGEEFLIVLPNCRLHDAYRVVEGLRKNISARKFIYENMEIDITLTFGLCEYRKGMSAEYCINRADKALYRGKHTGKNRVMTDPVDIEKAY